MKTSTGPTMASTSAAVDKPLPSLEVLEGVQIVSYGQTAFTSIFPGPKEFQLTKVWPSVSAPALGLPQAPNQSVGR